MGNIFCSSCINQPLFSSSKIHDNIVEKAFSLHYIFRQTEGQHAAKCVSTRLAVSMSVSVSDQWWRLSWLILTICVYVVCVYVQLPADFSRLHLADGLHPQVTHVSSSHSGCSITSDSGSSSLSDIYQVRMPPPLALDPQFGLPRIVQ